MTNNPNKKTFWDKITSKNPRYSFAGAAGLQLAIWSTSKRGTRMMERKVGQAMGLVIMVVMAQSSAPVRLPYLYIFCIILLVA